MHTNYHISYNAGCSISQNSASVFFRGYLNSASVDSILPRYFSRIPKFCLGMFDFYLGIFSRLPQFCLGNLDLPPKLPRLAEVSRTAEKLVAFATVRPLISNAALKYRNKKTKMHRAINFIDSCIRYI